MAHLTKAKVYDIEDSNIALLGSDVGPIIGFIDIELTVAPCQLEKHVREHAGDSEPAWKTAGKTQGLEIWRIEKFQVKPWPVERHGYFYDGDCYIVLNASFFFRIQLLILHFT